MSTKNIAIEAYRIPEKTEQASFDAVFLGEGHIEKDPHPSARLYSEFLVHYSTFQRS